MLLLLVSFSYTYAWDEYETYEKTEPTKMEDREVIYYDHGLELELDDGEVEAEWDKFDIDGFDWYKLVYSTTNNQPVYPHDKSIFIGSIDQRETTFRLQKWAENHYVRLCAVVLNDDYSKDRYCGEVQKLIAEVDDEEEHEEHRICTKEYSPVCGVKWDQLKTYSNKCMLEKSDAAFKYTGRCNEKIETVKKRVEAKKIEKVEKIQEKKTEIQDKKEERKTTMTKALQERVDTLLENFVSKLEDKWLSDADMIVTLEKVITRLEQLKEQDKYKILASYMIESLEEYKNNYDDSFSEIEKIFSDF